MLVGNLFQSLGTITEKSLSAHEQDKGKQAR